MPENDDSEFLNKAQKDHVDQLVTERMKVIVKDWLKIIGVINVAGFVALCFGVQSMAQKIAVSSAEKKVDDVLKASESTFNDIDLLSSKVVEKKILFEKLSTDYNALKSDFSEVKKLAEFSSGQREVVLKQLLDLVGNTPAEEILDHEYRLNQLRPLLVNYEYLKVLWDGTMKKRLEDIERDIELIRTKQKGHWDAINNLGRKLES